MHYFAQKRVLEVGGPTAEFAELYKTAASIDNVRFALNTTWCCDPVFQFDGRILGRLIVGELLELSTVAPGPYDAVVSCDVLEHCANPLKGLREMQKVVARGGRILIVLPYYRQMFDHRRSPTPFEHLLRDEENDVREDDLTHLDEILRAHDLAMDPQAGSPEQFRQRSARNFENRCLHHHVFDEENVTRMLRHLGLTAEVLGVERDKLVVLVPNT